MKQSLFLRLLKDLIARRVMLLLTLLGIFTLIWIGAGLLYKSWSVLQNKQWIDLLFTSSWKPFKGEFGFLAFITGTLSVTFIAVLVAVPLAVLSAIYLSEYASIKMRRMLMPIVDLLSGIPPVIYGVWGTLTIVPFVSEKLAPHFVEYSTGYSVLSGGLVLAIMIIPLIISILIEVFAAVPTEIREASWSLGATQWQTIKKVVLRKSFAGLIAAIMLAISRAFGETIAVLMVCGNVTDIPRSLFDPCYPLPALIANNYGEMMSLPDYESALMFAALLLFVIIVLFNALSRIALHHLTRRYTL